MLFSKKELNFEVPKVMGVINLTPDSFSDGGNFTCSKTLKTDRNKVLKFVVLFGLKAFLTCAAPSNDGSMALPKF